MKSMIGLFIFLFSTFNYAQTISDQGFELCYDVKTSRESNSKFCLFSNNEDETLVELKLHGKIYKLLNPEISSDLYVDLNCECMKYTNIYSKDDISYHLETFSKDGSLLEGTLTVNGVFSKETILKVERVVD